jgi:hypothetical protein
MRNQFGNFVRDKRQDTGAHDLPNKLSLLSMDARQIP